MNFSNKTTLGKIKQQQLIPPAAMLQQAASGSAQPAQVAVVGRAGCIFVLPAPIAWCIVYYIDCIGHIVREEPRFSWRGRDLG